MGGCAGREIVSNEERAIDKGVKLLGWQGANSKDLIINFKMYSKSNWLNENALRQAAKASNIDMTGLDDLSTFRGKFFATFNRVQDDSLLFDEQTLVILAILLGKGDQHLKAELLFEQFDWECSGKLTREEILNMVNCLIQVSCELIPNLGIGDGIEGFMTGAQIESYKERMRPEVDDTAKDLVNVMIQGWDKTQDKEGLVLRLRPGRHQTLLTSYGGREAV